jgi:hypothetical protein
MLIIFRAILLSWLCIVASLTQASVSTISFAETNNSNAVIIEGDDADLLTPSAPNSHGVSVVRLSELSLQRPLRIVNLTDDVRVAAKLIIIEASKLSLNSSIEILGERADLLIFNKSSNSVTTCSGCALVNVGRATLASANVSYDTNKWPATISPISSSSISINNLSAKGIGALELVASKIVLNGETNTQLKANYSSDGSFLLDAAGRYIVGSGNVNLYAGFNFHYKDLDLSTTTSSATYGIEVRGNIKTLAAKLVSTNPVYISGSIDTTSDIASATSYQGSIALIKESIKVTTLRTGSSLIVNGKLYSDNNIQLASSGQLIVNGQVTADSFDGIAATKFANRGRISASVTNTAAESVENNGLLNGRVVSVSAEDALLNRFGGKVLGETISLTSALGSIRNGSQYPFKPANDFSLLLAPDAQDDIDVSSIRVNDISLSGATKVSDLSAQIIGNIVSLKAKVNVENINPYFEYTLDPEAWRSGIAFNTQSADRVQLIADTQLDIHADAYVLNSSAIMGVNEPAGNFRIVSGNLANERYTTEAVIQPFEREETNSTSVTTKTGHESLLVAFSPPGIIYSFAPMGVQFNSSNGAFINNTSYFEILNSATFISINPSKPSEILPGKITSIGLALQDKYEGSSTIVIRSDKGCSNNYSYDPSSPISSEGQSRLYYSTCGSWASNSAVDLNGDTDNQMKGTLFSVQKNLSGKKTDFHGANHEMIKIVDDEIVAAKIAENTWSESKTKSGYNSQGEYYSIDYVIESTSKLNEAGDYLVTTHTLKNIELTEGAVSSPTGPVPTGWVPPEIYNITNQAKTISQKVEDIVVAAYDSVKQVIMDWLIAFDNWWNS